MDYADFFIFINIYKFILRTQTHSLTLIYERETKAITTTTRATTKKNIYI